MKATPFEPQKAPKFNTPEILGSSHQNMFLNNRHQNVLT